MKALKLIGLCLAFAPSAVLAQTAAPDVAPPHPDFAAMQQMHAQMEQIHQQARSQILGALTPAHRALLANVVGQLAVAPNPDRAAAARALDAALTQNEARAILAASSAARTQSHALMESARAQFEASLPADQRARMQQHMEVRPEGQEPGSGKRETLQQRESDPGEQLLDIATGGGHDHMYMMMHAGPGMPPLPK